MIEVITREEHRKMHASFGHSRRGYTRLEQKLLVMLNNNRTPSLPMILSVDFDGIITHSDNFPAIENPDLDMIDMLKRLKEQHHVALILNTCRIHTEPVVEFCRGYGLTFDAVNDNLPEAVEYFGNNTRKVHADVYLDDKALNPFN